MRTINYSTATNTAKAAFIDAITTAEARRAAGESYAEKGGALDKAKEAAKALNASIVADAVKDFVSLATTDKAAFFKAYMEDWAVYGYDLDMPTDKGSGAVQSIGYKNDKELRIPFSSIDSAMTGEKLTVRGDWNKMVQIFVNNCALHSAADGGVSMGALPSDLNDHQKTLGENWYRDGKPVTSTGGLTNQLNDIVKAIFPADMAVAMRKADVRNVADAVKSYRKTNINTAMRFKIATRISSVESILFDAIYTRMNNLSVIYEDDYKRKADKNPELDEKAAKAVSDIIATGVDMDALLKAARAMKKAEKAEAVA